MWRCPLSHFAHIYPQSITGCRYVEVWPLDNEVFYNTLVLFLSLRLAALAALFSFRLSTGAFLADFSLPSFSFDMLFVFVNKTSGVIAGFDGDDAHRPNNHFGFVLQCTQIKWLIFKKLQIIHACTLRANEMAYWTT
jgi:hypothetical protein